MRTVVVLLAALAAASCSSGAEPAGSASSAPSSSAAPTTGPGVYTAPSPIATTCTEHLGYRVVADLFGKPSREPQIYSNKTDRVSCDQPMSGAKYDLAYLTTEIDFEVSVEKARDRYKLAKEYTDPKDGEIKELPGYGDQAHWFRNRDDVAGRPGLYQVCMQRSNAVVTVRLDVGQNKRPDAETTELRDAIANYADATLETLPHN